MQVRKQHLELDMEQDWFQVGKGVHQDCILSPCLFNLYAEYIMQNAGLHGLENSMDCLVHGVTNSWDMNERLSLSRSTSWN